MYLFSGLTEHKPRSLAEVKKVVDKQHGVLLLVTLQHLQKLLKHRSVRHFVCFLFNV